MNLGDIVAFLVATFLLGPMQSELSEQLRAARAPAPVVQGVARCAADAAPALVARAVGDPWWAVTTAVGAWTGFVRPEAVLRDAAPGCAPAMEAARPFFAGS